jgi:hypothetical protein
MNFCSQLQSKSFMLKKVLRTSLAAARGAEKLTNSSAMAATPGPEKTGRCLKPCVQLVGRKQPYRLSRPVIDPYIAEIASRLEETAITKSTL